MMKLVAFAALAVLGCASMQGSSPHQGSAGSTGDQGQTQGQSGSSGSGAVACERDLDCPIGACIERVCRNY